MSEFTFSDLLPRIEGWTVRSATTLHDITEVRLTTPVDTLPNWHGANAAVYVTELPQAHNRPEVVGGSLLLREDSLHVGGLPVPRGSAFAGQMLEEAILVVPPPCPDPVSSPTEASQTIIECGHVVWPPETDLPEPHRSTELLEGVTQINLITPSLVTTTTVESEHQTLTFDTFVSPYVAVETARSGVDTPMFVSYYPLSDIPRRLLDRSGLGRLLSPGTAVGTRQSVILRSTFLTDQGLMIGALAWHEDEKGRLTTSEGETTALAITSEVLGILPGGDFHPARHEEVVGGM